MTVKVYSTPTCGYCKKVKALLDELGVKYEAIDVSADDAALNKMFEISGQQGVPVTVIGDSFVIGYDKAAIEDKLKAAGLLK